MRCYSLFKCGLIIGKFDSVAWCKKHDVPIEKMLSKTLRTKFGESATYPLPSVRTEC